MRKLARLCCVGVGAALFGAVAGGCSTTVISQKTIEKRDAAIEREALVRAAGIVSETKWPKPEQASWRSMLTGMIGGDADRVSNQDAVTAYLAMLDEHEPVDQVMADASGHLSAAENLVQVAEAAAISIRPTGADIVIVEGAIGQLRQTRDVYVACLKSLSKDGQAIADDDVRALRQAFNSAIEDVGGAADQLADALEDDRTETYASPGRALNLNGSL